MGMYIPGIEMPTDNTVLIRVFPASQNGECYVQQLDVDGDILGELWAIHVPPHGRLIVEDDAVETAWMILAGLGYRREENPQLEQTVREVYATAPTVEVE